MTLVKCSHCGEHIPKEEVVPCIWKEYNITWYYCKRCNDCVFGGFFKNESNDDITLKQED